MSRMIDADELKKNSDITNWNKPYGCSFDTIDRIPTAYDVEKVIEEAKKQLSKLLHICDLEDVDKVYNFYDSLEATIRKGGVE